MELKEEVVEKRYRIDKKTERGEKSLMAVIKKRHLTGIYISDWDEHMKQVFHYCLSSSGEIEGIPISMIPEIISFLQEIYKRETGEKQSGE